MRQVFEFLLFVQDQIERAKQCRAVALACALILFVFNEPALLTWRGLKYPTLHWLCLAIAMFAFLANLWIALKWHRRIKPLRATEKALIGWLRAKNTAQWEAGCEQTLAAMKRLE